MSSDLRDLIRNDLDRIPLPPDERWTMARARRGGSFGVGVAVIVIVLAVAASLGGGQALQAIRDRIESDRASGGVVVPGDDYVYVSDGGPSPVGATATQGIQTIAMPAGGSTGRVIADTYVGTAYDGALMGIRGDRAFLPAAMSAAGDDYDTYLQEVDLSRGLVLRRVSLGTAPAPRALQAELPGTPVFPASAAVSSDGSSVWLVRDTFDQGRTTVVDRFDGQTLSPLAHMILSSSGSGAVRSRAIAFGPDRLAVVRYHYESLNLVAADWYFLDAQLRVIASYADDYAHRLPDSGMCSADVKASPVNAEWLVLCSDPSLAGDGALLFIDSNTSTITASVSLPREQGFAAGMTAAVDNTVYVLTGRPVVTRIDPRTHRTIDARTVIQARSWLDQLTPPVVGAKSPGGPSATFSPDGRYAYLVGGPDQWWGSLATIDMREAKVVAHTSAFGAIAAVELSPGGERLYALATDRLGVRRILLLAPDTLRSVSQSDPIANEPFGIFAVRTQTQTPKQAAASRGSAGPQPTLHRFAAGSPTALLAGLAGDPDFARMIAGLTSGADPDPRAVGRIVVPGVPLHVRGLGSDAQDEYVIPLLVDNTTIAIVWTPVDRDGFASLGGMRGWSNATTWPPFDAAAARARGSVPPDAVVGMDLVWANVPGFGPYNPFWKVTRSSGDVFYLLEDGTLISAQAMPIP
jgi:DNA-binding beta-propeller fold protein YncE